MDFITLNGVEKTYQSGPNALRVLGPLTMSVTRGEFTVVMGPSGSGKSTLLTLMGFLSASSRGTITIDGINVSELDSERLALFRREYVGFVFQAFHLLPYLTVIQNVMIPLMSVHKSSVQKRKMAEAILDRVGLHGKENRIPDELSGGEQQRVAIARALVNQPPLVLADEPTGNLDTATSAQIMSLMKEFHDDGHTCVLVTHNEEYLRAADRVVYLRDGSMIKQVAA